MSNIVACYKWVIDEVDIRVHSDLSVDTSRAGGKISEYDKNVIELAVQIASESSGKAVGLTFGDEKTRKSLKDGLSRGLDETFWVTVAEADVVDGAVTGRALAAGVEALGDVSLVVCAEGASDTYARQTAPRLGALLDLPVITSACQVTVSGTTLSVVRRLEDTLETVQTELPAVVAVLPEINRPTIPGLRAVMAAGKKPVTERTATDLGVDMKPASEITGLQGYAQERKNVLIEGEDMPGRVAALVLALKKEGVI